MRVERRCIINADREAVWKVVSDPECYPSFLANFERWESDTEGKVGLGRALHRALEDRLGAESLQNLKKLLES